MTTRNLTEVELEVLERLGVSKNELEQKEQDNE